MNSFDSQRQAAADCFKRRWPDRRLGSFMAPTASFSAPPLPSSSPSPPPPQPSGLFLKANNLHGGEEELVSTVIPPVTVVLEGRSICQRISLHKHASYESLAKALRGMFVEEDGEVSLENGDHRLDLSNAVPGHLVAYEDIENDLLLAGDLNWNDFVRVAKRIRILPVKANSRRGRGGV